MRVRVRVNNGGAGYTSTPTVSIVGGSGSGATATAIVGTRYNYSIAETLSTIDEQGYINLSDYSVDVGDLWLPLLPVTVGQTYFYNDRLYTVTVAGTTSSTPPSHLSGTESNGTATLEYTRVFGPAIDGSYSGEIVRQFYVQTTQENIDPESVCIVKVDLGPLTKYPGYYQNNDGFLDDAIFIQDSKYYQAFSYVLKINEKLETYKSAVKTLIHPSGMALFGEYDIRNDFDISSSLEFLMQIFSLFEQDQVQTDDSSIKDVSKGLGSQLDYDGNTESTNVTVPDTQTKLITKGDFPETVTASNTGNIFWTHVDSFSGAIQNFTIPIIDVTSWDIYEDSVVLSDSDDLNINKNLTEDLLIEDSLSIEITKSISDVQQAVDFTTYTVYFGEGNEDLEYFASNYVEQTPTITVSLV